jgi:hypothetical protein
MLSVLYAATTNAGGAETSFVLGAIAALLALLLTFVTATSGPAAKVTSALFGWLAVGLIALGLFLS